MENLIIRGRKLDNFKFNETQEKLKDILKEELILLYFKTL